MPSSWEVTSEDPYVLRVRGADCEGCHPSWSADVKKDGCLHLYRYYNGEDSDDPKADPDYLHICHLPDFITLMEQLQDLARTYYGSDWPGH